MTADAKASPAPGDAPPEPSFCASYAPPDEAVAAELFERASRPAGAEGRIDAYARRLIAGIRARGWGLGGIEDFLHAYSLSTREGLALMVLAHLVAQPGAVHLLVAEAPPLRVDVENSQPRRPLERQVPIGWRVEGAPRPRRAIGPDAQDRVSPFKDRLSRAGIAASARRALCSRLSSTAVSCAATSFGRKSATWRARSPPLAAMASRSQRGRGMLPKGSVGRLIFVDVLPLMWGRNHCIHSTETASPLATLRRSVPLPRTLLRSVANHRETRQFHRARVSQACSHVSRWP